MQPNDTIRQWYELAACRLPVLRSAAAAAATEHGTELSKAEVTLVFKQYMEDLKIELRPDQLGKKWTYYKSCTESKMRRMAGPQDLEAVPDAIHSVLNWLDRLAGALQRDRATSEFQDAQRKGGVASGVSGLSATEQEARTAIRIAKLNIWRANFLEKEYMASKRSSFEPWERRLLDAYRQGSLQQRLVEVKSQYQGDPMHRSPLPP